MLGEMPIVNLALYKYGIYSINNHIDDVLISNRDKRRIYAPYDSTASSIYIETDIENRAATRPELEPLSGTGAPGPVPPEPFGNAPAYRPIA